MGPISTATFIYRDLVRYILPAVIGLILFLPLALEPDKMPSLAVLGVWALIWGLIVSEPILGVASWLFDTIFAPSLVEEFKWWEKNWNYPDMFYGISQEKRDYLYMTAAYLYFYQGLMLYLFLYAAVNVATLVWSPYLVWLWPPELVWLDGVKEPILSETTTIFGGLRVNTAVVAVISLVLGYCSLRYAKGEYEALFLGEGEYVTFSKRLQKKEGGIAQKLWGRVTQGNEPKEVADALIQVKDASGNLLSEEKRTDEKGRFQFDNDVLKSILGKSCTVQVKFGCSKQQESITFTDKDVPQVNFHFPGKNAQ